ncbi:transcription factor MYB88 isoform X2 [Telopea speciosissima]|uniref:transcription factor MYB88 isoform X2 n=1 Tax=Telopea speciosissima TaxID=54955 RepID=UPI001CC71E49|nr:transcription factor MYB88 isoform X2 [Telopea speciosissima]
MRNMKLLEAPKPEATTKQKERHIVTWTQEEDDILREQISHHGTENWTIIAAKFKDKTTRQCRRRWYTYLNTDCKKGGWSPEEDMILCEAQKIFGNRWTEISKVVSGRTDNAVKNRFSTLCKKRAKREALSKENNTSCINPNNKRVIDQNGFIMNGSSESTPPLKKMRTQILNLTENTKEGSLRQCVENHQLRPPFAVLVQNLHNIGNLSAQQHVSNNIKAASNDGADDKGQVTFLRRDDPKITALMQQAELLSSLALKVNTDDTNQSLENAWKELQDFLNESKDGDLLRYRISEMDFLPEDYEDLVEDLASGNMGSQQSWRQPDLYEESPGSSEYSTGSTLRSHAADDKTEQHQAEVCSLHQDNIVEPQLPHTREAQNDLSGCDDGISTISTEAEIFLSHEGSKENGVLPVLPNTEFSSPVQVTPLFRSLAAEIPSPKFSESERNFLLKTLGLGSPTPHPSTNPSQPPPCRRALLHSL